MKKLARILIVPVFALSLATEARAEGAGGAAEGIPAHAVARLKLLQGSAWIRTPEGKAWEDALNNLPVHPGARISVPEGSEAELQFHGGQFMLLASGSDLEVAELGERVVSFRLRDGEIRLDLPPEDFAPVRVELPSGGRVKFPVPGNYWLFASGKSEARLVVRKGEAEAFAELGDARVRAGEEAYLGREVRVSRYPGDEVAEDEDPGKGLTPQETEAAIPPAAAYELRSYGEWIEIPVYGYVWRPYVVAGWSPYYYGTWYWAGAFGWTWISYEPWGWYPYHYGYWHSHPVHGWCWYPYRSFPYAKAYYGRSYYPDYHGRVYYQNATVRFVRDGSTVRWVPMAPGERADRSRFLERDRALRAWDRPVSRNTVFARTEGVGRGKLRDAMFPRSGTERPPARTVVVREGTRQPVPGSRGKTESGGPGRGSEGARTNVTGGRTPGERAPAVRGNPASRSGGSREGNRHVPEWRSGAQGSGSGERRIQTVPRGEPSRTVPSAVPKGRSGAVPSWERRTRHGGDGPPSGVRRTVPGKAVSNDGRSGGRDPSGPSTRRGSPAAGSGISASGPAGRGGGPRLVPSSVPRPSIPSPGRGSGIGPVRSGGGFGGGAFGRGSGGGFRGGGFRGR